MANVLGAGNSKNSKYLCLVDNFNSSFFLRMFVAAKRSRGNLMHLRLQANLVNIFKL